MNKCIRCGAEIGEGVFECPVCGAAVQLVPNYESLDLDLMIHKNATAGKKMEEIEKHRKERRSQIKKLEFIKRICTVAIVAFAVIGVGVALISIKSTMASTINGFESAYNDALQLYEDGEYQDAYNAISTALEYDAENIDALVLKARISYFGLENLDEAESILRSIITDDSEEERAYEALIEIYLDAEQYDSLAYILDTAAESVQATFAEYIVEAPEFSIAEGTYSESLTVAISSSEGYDIYYTTSSSAAFEDYTLYSEPLELESGSTSVLAVAVNDSGLRSITQTMTYSIVLDTPDTPVIMTASGTYSGSDNTVVIGDVEDATVYYAIDAKPTTQSAVYTEPIEMQEGKHFVYAFAVNDQGVESSITAIWYQYTADSSASSESSESDATPTPTPTPNSTGSTGSGTGGGTNPSGGSGTNGGAGTGNDPEPGGMGEVIDPSDEQEGGGADEEITDPSGDQEVDGTGNSGTGSGTGDPDPATSNANE